MEGASNRRKSDRVEAQASPGRATWITPSNAIYYAGLVEDCEAGETLWSISRNARCGDRVLLYICRPVMAIVATATLVADPQVLDDPTNEWTGTFMAAMDSLRLLNPPITRAVLMRTFPEWRYWLQPHRSSRVKEAYLERLGRLLNPE